MLIGRGGQHQVGFFDQFTVSMSRLTQGVVLDDRDHLDARGTF